MRPAAGDDDKFWAYVRVTSAIAHRAPILQTLWTLVPWYHDWDKICMKFGCCNMALSLLGYTKQEAEEVYMKRSPPASTHVTSATITTCIRKPDGEPYWSFTVNDVMCTGANQSYLHLAREVIRRAIAGGTAPQAIRTRLEALLPFAKCAMPWPTRRSRTLFRFAGCASSSEIANSYATLLHAQVLVRTRLYRVLRRARYFF